METLEPQQQQALILLAGGLGMGAFFCEAKGSASCNSNTASKFDGKSVFIK